MSRVWSREIRDENFKYITTVYLAPFVRFKATASKNRTLVVNTQSSQYNLEEVLPTPQVTVWACDTQAGGLPEGWLPWDVIKEAVRVTGMDDFHNTNVDLLKECTDMIGNDVRYRPEDVVFSQNEHVFYNYLS
ncbi:hypothetical protein HK102_010657, partial [Quaeritorhiza haematococci]